ncbi:MAG: hypothetical protein JSR96_09740 [Proteobacteria bacterium]|nr:hypothetical protein [Pseudomonadota bacterium]
MSDVIAYLILSMGSAVIGLCVAIALGRFKPDQSHRQRVAVSMVAAMLPVVLLAVGACVWAGISPFSFEEFWTPFVIQLSMIAMFSLPMVLWGARRSRNSDASAQVFE